MPNTTISPNDYLYYSYFRKGLYPFFFNSFIKASAFSLFLYAPACTKNKSSSIVTKALKPANSKSFIKPSALFFLEKAPN